MENLQSTPPQKTSFWDFKKKKNYFGRKEKAIDFLVGLLFFWFMMSFVGMWLWGLDHGKGGALYFLIAFPIIYIYLFVHLYKKRVWIFYGGLTVTLYYLLGNLLK
ncbi:MAG: hypothetical protein A2174_01710 [Candidatus Portnoybacteria bacterium RBG_13_41_18]|uniref:Uncharacterized protein n=1 Tax=Candidatus Portnoybacteria bacterium RBG_13_41_18 TaxID=1801991 RepID=A0A1G2FC46_9BACT|nr:MAG: hypothetical protein A2174_01710 [Candidatus Portnoybacteria bacterium RBG_13_41_18]